MHGFVKLIALTALIAPALGVSATEITATQAFSTVPRKVLPLLDENARLDMIDYCNSNMTNATENIYGGRSRIVQLSPESLTAQLTDATECQMAILPDGKEGLIAMISTVATPAPDSNMSVFTSDWSRDVTSSVFAKPAFAEWLTPEGKKHSAEVETTVPFLLVRYSYDPATQTLTLTNNAEEFLGKDVFAPIKNYLSPALKYKFNGKRFVKIQ